MGKNDIWANDLLKLVFNNTGAGLIGDTTGLLPSGTVGSLYVSLHTADPADLGDQTTSEIAYTSYARVAVVRSSAGWTITDTEPPQVQNAALVAFPACTGLTPTATYFGVGTALSGTGKRLYSGALTASLAISSGITPQFAINALTITET